VGEVCPPPYFKLLSGTAYINWALRSAILVISRPIKVTSLNIYIVVLVCFLVYTFSHSWTSGSLYIKYMVNISSLKL
jgi:hypothetical protein